MPGLSRFSSVMMCEPSGVKATLAKSWSSNSSGVWVARRGCRAAPSDHAMWVVAVGVGDRRALAGLTAIFSGWPAASCSWCSGCARRRDPRAIAAVAGRCTGWRRPDRRTSRRTGRRRGSSLENEDSHSTLSLDATCGRRSCRTGSAARERIGRQALDRSADQCVDALGVCAARARRVGVPACRSDVRAGPSAHEGHVVPLDQRPARRGWPCRDGERADERVLAGAVVEDRRDIEPVAEEFRALGGVARVKR